MRTARLKAHLLQELAHGDATTGELLDSFNTRYRHGTTMPVIGNVLGKDPAFVQVGYVDTIGGLFRLRQAKWKLALEVDVDA